ncbi:helix-turn-helix domain-containing protein [Robiginitalea sp. 2V75]|uniref:Helix-turn-helix domain-containing protein n=2 Tax=Robiginitalea marina TaxID=2954105 RepID=A0ABT1B0N5_9FLAO|nr:helix-turn-helix domain-containing protein [Robiginitalea marina]
MVAPQIFVARDINEMASAFVGWQMDVIQQEKGTFQGNLRGFSQLEGKVNFYSAYTGKRVFANGHHLKGSVMFTFIDCPGRCIWNGEEVTRSKLLVTDAERGLDVDAASGFTSYSVSIDEALLVAWLRSEGIPLPLSWNFTIDLQSVKRRATAGNLRWIIINAIQFGKFEVAELKWALYELLNPECQNCMKYIAVNFVAIHEIVEFIHQTIRSGKDVDVEALVDLYGGPMRTLYYNFKKYTGFTPHRYIKNLRLAMAQKLLKVADPSFTEVRAIAYQLGFMHLGQFSADYKGLFGEVPSETLRRRQVLQ